MAVVAGRLRVHLFVARDIQIQQESLERQLFGDQRQRTILGYPRDLNEIMPGDYAILWRKKTE